MKNRSIYIVISILTLALGIAAVWAYYRYESPQIQTNVPRFRYVSGSPTCSSIHYRFQSSTEPKVFGADCVFCREIGNISVRKESISAEHTRFLINAYSEDGIVEKTIKTDKNDSKIGDRIVWISKHNGNIKSASIVWTENTDFWVINAPALELVKEFEESETFKSVKADVDSTCLSK